MPHLWRRRLRGPGPPTRHHHIVHNARCDVHFRTGGTQQMTGSNVGSALFSPFPRSNPQCSAFFGNRASISEKLGQWEEELEHEDAREFLLDGIGHGFRIFERDSVIQTVIQPLRYKHGESLAPRATQPSVARSWTPPPRHAFIAME